MESNRCRLVIGLAVAALACPASAVGAQTYRAPLYVALDSALVKARALWGTTPCGGDIRLELAKGSDLGDAEMYEPVAQPAGWSRCVLRLDREAWAPDRLDTTWSRLCTIVLHEYGHLTGRGHSDDPRTPDAAGLAPETPEQAAVMLSGTNPGQRDDIARCGRRPPSR